MSQKHEKLRQEVRDATALVNICVVHCNTNRTDVCELKCNPVQGTTVGICFVNIEDKNYDMAAETIESANIIVFAVSLDFVVQPEAFTTMIFVMRTLKKESLYFLVGETYLDFVSNSKYINSTVSLLIGNEWLHQDWGHLYEGPITNLCKRVEAEDNFKGETNDVGLDLAVDFPGQYCYCFAEEDWIHVKTVILGLRLTKGLPFVDLKSAVPTISEDDAISSGRISCCLICVSTSLARDVSLRPLLDKLMDSSTPKVVLVINDSSNSSWLRTGLGLRLADELWVDCTNKLYYLPGEIVPSLEDKLKEICVRVKNISSVPPSAISGTLPSSATKEVKEQREIFVYVAECIRGTCMDLVRAVWPLPAYTDTTFYHMPKDPFRFASFFSTHGKESGINLECDQKWSREVNFFTAANDALNKSHVIIQWWSVEFVTSYFCYADVELTLKMFSDRVIILIFLEEFSVILQALKSMPKHKKIVDMLFQLHRCRDSTFAYRRRENILYVNLVENEHLDFEKTATHILQLMIDSHHNRFGLNISQVVSASDPGHSSWKRSPHSSCVAASSQFDILISYCWSNSSIAREKVRNRGCPSCVLCVKLICHMSALSCVWVLCSVSSGTSFQCFW